MGSEDLQDLRYDVVDHVGVVTFARPDRLNAFFAQEHCANSSRCSTVSTPTTMCALSSSPATGRAFCAGADISGGARAFEPTPAKADTPAVAPPRRWRHPGVTHPRAAEAHHRRHQRRRRGYGRDDDAADGRAPRLSGSPLRVPVHTPRHHPGGVQQLVPATCRRDRYRERVDADRTRHRHAGQLAAGLVRSLHAPDDLLPAAHELAREICDNAAPVSTAMTRQLLWRMLGAEDPNRRAPGRIARAHEPVALRRRARRRRIVSGEATTRVHGSRQYRLRRHVRRLPTESVKADRRISADPGPSAPMSLEASRRRTWRRRER